MLNTPLLVGVMVIGALAAIVVVILAVEFAPPSVEMGMRIGVLTGAAALVLACILRFQKVDLRNLRALMEKSKAEPIAARVKAAISVTHSIWPQTTTRELAKILAEENSLDTIIRIAPPDGAPPIKPIAVPFEPHRPDELGELMAAAEHDAEHVTAETRKAPPRGIQRNVVLKGGWLLVGLYGVVWTVHAIEAIRSGAVTPRFMMWTLVLLTFILFPVGSSWIGGNQWLAVPGGLVVRKSAWLRRGWTSHLFCQGNAVVIVYRLYRRQWVLIAADGDSCESTIGTRAELECTLGAWLSPVPPPTREELADWI